jgi:hypothetical protein
MRTTTKQGTVASRKRLIGSVLYICVVFHASYFVPGIYRRWEYDRTYSSELALPNNLNGPFARSELYPGTTKRGLYVQIFKPDSTDDAEIRSWIARHNRMSAFVPSFKTLKGPLCEWEARRGPEFIRFDRMDEDGWISINVFERPSH